MCGWYARHSLGNLSLIFVLIFSHFRSLTGKNWNQFISLYLPFHLLFLLHWASRLIFLSSVCLGSHLCWDPPLQLVWCLDITLSTRYGWQNTCTAHDVCIVWARIVSLWCLQSSFFTLCFSSTWGHTLTSILTLTPASRVLMLDWHSGMVTFCRFWTRMILHGGRLVALSVWEKLPVTVSTFPVHASSYYVLGSCNRWIVCT